MGRDLRRISKFLSYVLRHDPDSIGLSLDDGGWIGVTELLAAVAKSGRRLDRETLHEVVATNDKKRFAFSEDGTRIRASQGHSIPIDLGLTALAPPERLFHGTAQRNLDSIREKGLLAGRRHHVHLSLDAETARSVGGRHGKPVILVIHALEMHEAGTEFLRSDNGVWLVDHVPPHHIEFPV